MELKTARGRLFLFTLLLFAFPLLNHHFRIIKSSPLKNVTLAEKPVFSSIGFWHGTYQASLNTYLNDVIGFREDMVRFNNQIDFTFFYKVNSKEVKVGRHKNLFHSNYVDAYCGTDYAGDNYPLRNLQKMKKVQDTLERMGKLFVFVHAASKVSYYSEDLPLGISCNSPGKTNLKNYKHICDSLGIHQIDFNAWYVSLKGKTPHPLFNKLGIHWSLYGAFYAIDSLIRYIECKRNIRMIHPNWSEIEHSHNAIRSEADMEKLLNIIFPVDTATYWYPRWNYNDSAGRTKPRIIYIGDSFFNTLLYDGIMHSNTKAEYWYYFKDVFITESEPKWVSGDMATYNWREPLQKTDCVILIYTAYNLVKQSNTFIDSAYNYYYPGK